MPSASTATTGAGNATATTAPSFSGSKNSKYCNLARQFSQTITPGVSNDPKTLFQKFDSVLPEYLAAVPSAIKADSQAVIAVFQQLETRLKSVNYDYTKLGPADLALVQDPKFTAALNRLSAYDAQVCGLTTTTT